MTKKKREVVEQIQEQIIKPGVFYNWKDDASFQLNGKEFGALFNYLESYVNSPAYQYSIVAGNLHQVMLKKLEGAIVSGIAVAQEEQK